MIESSFRFCKNFRDLFCKFLRIYPSSFSLSPSLRSLQKKLPLICLILNFRFFADQKAFSYGCFRPHISPVVFAALVTNKLNWAEILGSVRFHCHNQFSDSVHQKWRLTPNRMDQLIHTLVSAGTKISKCLHPPFSMKKTLTETTQFLQQQKSYALNQSTEAYIICRLEETICNPFLHSPQSAQSTV